MGASPPPCMGTGHAPKPSTGRKRGAVHDRDGRMGRMRRRWGRGRSDIRQNTREAHLCRRPVGEQDVVLRVHRDGLREERNRLGVRGRAEGGVALGLRERGVHGDHGQIRSMAAQCAPSPPPSSATCMHACMRPTLSSSADMVRAVLCLAGGGRARSGCSTCASLAAAPATMPW